MDPQVFVDAARYAHIIAVAIGFGAAFLADFHVISRLGRPIDDNLTTTLHLCHRVIWAMVFGMWVTGLGLIYIRTGFDPANITPKLIAKIITVTILTANAMLISKIAVPLVEENRGRSLMLLPLRSKLSLAGIGAISSASWMLALAFGSSKVLAASDWIVFAFLMPLIYFLGVFAAVAVMFLLHLGGEMVAQRPVSKTTIGPGVDRRTPARVPLDGNIFANAAEVEQILDAQIDDRPKDRNLSLRVAAERKRTPVLPQHFNSAVEIAGE